MTQQSDEAAAADAPARGSAAPVRDRHVTSGAPTRLPRFPRLEAVLGCRLDDLDEGSVCALVDNRIAEAEDIEFKGALYGKGDSDKVELAKDVAALANHHGGVIVLGIGADSSGVAISASGIELRDGEADRMRQLVAERVSPMPDWSLKTIPSTGGQNRGWFVLVVPRSSLRPHLVRTSSGKVHIWRAPCRDAATTRDLTESEVADRYRDRFALAGDQTARLHTITQAASSEVASDEFAYLTVSIMPTRTGELRITRTTPAEVSSAVSGRRWPFGGEGVGHEGSIGIGRSELRPRLGIEERASRAAHFYTDGASSITSPVGSRTTGQAATSPQYLIDDEVLLGEIVNSLIAGASYATELTGSSGDALVRLHLHLRSAVATCQLQRSGARGRDGLWMQRVLGGSVTTDTMIVLEDFTGTAWSTRLRAISFASQRLYQAFGLPACPHLTESGQVRWAQFADATNVHRDAPNFDIELTTDVP